jgi:cell division septum initiation protein DivIVA
MTMDDLLDEGRRAFRTQMFGYDRGQVDEEFARLENQLDLVCADRDAALATAEELTRHLEEARSELLEYRTLHAGYDKDNAVSGCIRYLLHVARRKADEIEAEARARAEETVQRAEETAGRQARLLDEAEQETQRRLAEAGKRARKIVGEALRESRELLSELRERQRLLDQWYNEVTSAPVMPEPRSPEPLPVAPSSTDAEPRSVAG